MPHRRITRKMLPELALSQGVDVVRSDSGKVVFKRSGITIVMYESGALVRGDVDLSVAKAMSVVNSNANLYQ